MVIYSHSHCGIYCKYVMMVILALAKSINYYPRGMIYDHTGTIQFAAYLYVCNNFYSTGHWANVCSKTL